jgi:hypothetical protein
MNPASGTAGSRPRRIERRCVRVLLYASESICLLVFFEISSLDAGHSGQQPVTADLNEVDGLEECPSGLSSYTHSREL